MPGPVSKTDDRCGPAYVVLSADNGDTPSSSLLAGLEEGKRKVRA